ncbi:DMT family transporter [Campylobacter corcagiensis]|uniref:DMT family transporter n=1 Tax=Campylobacter corcagiensis TaxID=1448857 RepID=A0A7M1LH65_9BACT|nr:DMT family transporter [Campylobacter corcagiensis]QKF65520.1 putative inner membrane exporter, YdcZ family [Campylobacter corcagiensis]QOQ87908.1 DMT family transporter [Campylobacter corcagiensis]
MQIMFLFMAFLAGACLSVQAVINANLAAFLGAKPIMAAFISFTIGSLALLIVAIILGEFSFADIKSLKSIEIYKLIGGLLGAFAVFSTTFIAPKIGLILMFMMIIFAQLLSSFLIDSFGLLGLSKKEISLSKIVGLGLFIVGLFIYTLGDNLFKSNQ